MGENKFPLRQLAVAILLASEGVNADIGTLVIIVGDPKSNYENNPTGYRDSAQLASSVVKGKYPASKHEVILGGDKGASDWSFTENLQIAPTTQTFEANLSRIFKQIDAEKNSLIYISDHGAAPSAAEDPLSSSIGLGDRKAYSHHHLRTQIAELESRRTNGFTKIISMHCYGGAIHHIAMNQPRTCGIASASWSKKAFGWKFSPAFFNELKNVEFDFNGDGKTNLLESYARVLNEDSGNWPMQQTSSMAYLDFSYGRRVVRS